MAEGDPFRRRSLEKGLVYEPPKGEMLDPEDVTSEYYFIDNGIKYYITGQHRIGPDEVLITYRGGSRVVEANKEIEVFKKSPEERGY